MQCPVPCHPDKSSIQVTEPYPVRAGLHVCLGNRQAVEKYQMQVTDTLRAWEDGNGKLIPVKRHVCSMALCVSGLL